MERPARHASGPYHIREALPEDAPVLSALALRSKAYWGYSEDFIRSCEDELTVRSSDIGDSESGFVVAEYDGVVAGYAGFEMTAPDEFELTALFVEPEHIGKGVGRTLLQQAIREIDERGGRKVLIQGDPNAERFYLAAGARQVGTRESESIPGRHLPLFELAVSDARDA